MKKLILILSLFIFTSGCAFSQNITPQELKGKQTPDYRVVNKASAQIFKGLRGSVDVSAYPPIYNNFRLMPKENTQLTPYYYVKFDNAELMYSKETRALKYVTFRTKGKPRAWIIYNYPSGKLRQVDIWAYTDGVYSFNSDGVFIDYPRYKELIYKEVKNNIKLSPWTRMKLVLTGKSRGDVEVVLTIDYQGILQQCKALKQTKSEVYNNSIYDAIWKSSPFRAPYPFTTREVNVKLEF